MGILILGAERDLEHAFPNTVTPVRKELNPVPCILDGTFRRGISLHWEVIESKQSLALVTVDECGKSAGQIVQEGEVAAPKHGKNIEILGRTRLDDFDVFEEAAVDPLVTALDPTGRKLHPEGEQAPQNCLPAIGGGEALDQFDCSGLVRRKRVGDVFAIRGTTPFRLPSSVIRENILFA